MVSPAGVLSAIQAISASVPIRQEPPSAVVTFTEQSSPFHVQKRQRI
jgi:hypothetical protein